MKEIGFIGLGNMGLPMSRNLLAANYAVYGIDVNEKAEGAFAAVGGITGLTNEAIAKTCNVIFTSLPSSSIAESVYLGEQGLIAHSHPGIVLIDTSTVAPETNQKIATEAKKRGIDFLAAPVSGGVVGAENRTLTFMVGGSKEVYERVLPVLQVLGGNIFHVSEKIESGTVVKLINNLLIGFYTAGVSEALHLAKRSNMDLDQLFQILNVSYGQSRIYERNYQSFIATDHYEPGFSISLLNKDLGLALDLAKKANLHLPISEVLLSMYKETEQDGFGAKDMAALYQVISEKNSVQ